MTMLLPFTATVWKLEDNVNTDLLHPPDYFSLNDARMKAGVHEGMKRLQSAVSAHLSHDALVIVAGRNFGCGSSRETAVRALRAVGVKAVVARSFGRIFFRSLVNLGMPPLICHDFPDHINDGDAVTIDFAQGHITCDGEPPWSIEPLDAHVQKVILCGGLIHYLKKEQMTGSQL
ncbi:MAG: hypothetical protein RBT11_13665 [Desulfobacterales bacterium]|jgi:3-isopropylmalate dehydratase small subunit|nr:hypothetical protein [Desulfobacterales bacterium]